MTLVDPAADAEHPTRSAAPRVVTSVSIDDLDPQIAPAVAGLTGMVVTAETLSAYRTSRPASASTGRVHRSEHLVNGQAALRLRIHRPLDVDGELPCVVRMHGGGYVMGEAEFDDEIFARWCPALSMVGVSVDYRLAPEVPYPGPLEDCYRGLRWVREHAGRIGVDASRIGVAGISAGGGLAAALTLMLRDRGEEVPHFQLLDSPMLDDRQCTPSSRLDGLFVWSRESNEFGWRSYLGAAYGHDVPHTAAPSRCADLSGLPPTFISVGGLDGFRDEDVDYAARLCRSGVSCELHVYPNAPHGYYLAAGSDVARRSDDDMVTWLRRRLAS